MVFLRSEKSVQIFLQNVRHNGTIGVAVKSFHAVFQLQPERVAALRDCLELLHNLEDLQLILPHLTLSCWRRLLDGIQFH